MRISGIVTCTLLLFAATAALAQAPPERRQPSPEDTQKILESTLGAMGPMMGRMSEAMIEAQLRIAEKPETAERVATFKRNLFEALVKKGFRPLEALQIVVATGIPSAAPGTR